MKLPHNRIFNSSFRNIMSRPAAVWVKGWHPFFSCTGSAEEWMAYLFLSYTGDASVRKDAILPSGRFSSALPPAMDAIFPLNSVNESRKPYSADKQ